MSGKCDVVTIGSIMYDLITFTPRLPKPGESLPGCKFVTSVGGKGANSCVAVARLGAQTAMIGKIGNDTYGKIHIENFDKNGVNTDFVYTTSESSSGVGFVVVEETGENRIMVCNGANELLTVEEVDQAESTIKSAKVVSGNLEVNTAALKEAFRLAKKHKVTVLLNAAPAISNPDPEFYVLSDIFCVNETEAEITTGLTISSEDDAKQAVECLLQRGCKTVIITLGAKGVIFASQDNPDCVLIKSQKVTAVDSTGAGDAFVGALAFYLASYPELALKEMIRRSCCIATASVLVEGTQNSYAWRKDLPEELFSS